jgi:Predicted ATPase of the PP-loop superfamily implicated in cell cycle control
MKTALTYEKFVHDNYEYLKTFCDKHVYVAYAGGKDASVILHFFTRAKEEFGFEFETHAGMYPLHVYTNDDVDKLDSYWKGRGIRITWHPINKSEDAFQTALQQGTNPCEVCHAAKREYFLEYLIRTVTDWNSTALILGWSLWDIVSYTLEYILGSVYADREALYQGKTIKERFFRTAQRFYPMLQMKEGYTLYKPLLRYNDQDIVKVVRENEIPILTTDCKFKVYRPKRYLADSYIKMNMYFDYDKLMKFAREALNLEKPSSYTSMDKNDFIKSII